MRILITGGAGYLGSVLAERALSIGHDVTVLDDFSRSKTSLLHLAHYRGLKVVRGDARDGKILGELVPFHDTLVPLAGVVGLAACEMDPSRAAEVNIHAVEGLFRAREQVGDPDSQRVVFPATNSGYGTRTGQVACDEETPLDPISVYGRTKVAAENFVLTRQNAYSLRFATLFGPSPAMRWDLLVNSFVREALLRRYLVLFEPGYKRNYLHVLDAARAVLHVAAMFEPRHRVYNVGLPGALTKAELAGQVAWRAPCYLHEADVGKDPDQRNYEVSVDRITAAGFVPMVGLGEGIDQLVKAAVGALS